ncbi:hypothetical protein ASPTUDRAFT_40551 [Aspergillus tubingensis CBS 134.48]|uniref:Uncharacterized protein n=1 Tax=Aspergillus tubingensis (strain CBS 134.48) TaxID=767770 RepID=A0A1L9NDK0_ASPTC|nr:hypothetical protein ASPTUDRAFT_40551 [Aspergillus tubingensis CBS 134.48]
MIDSSRTYRDPEPSATTRPPGGSQLEPVPQLHSRTQSGTIAAMHGVHDAPAY